MGLNNNNNISRDNASKTGALSELLRKKLPVQFVLLFLLSLLVGLIASARFSGTVDEYQLGQYTTSNIRAPYPFSIVDDQATKEKRLEAAKNVIPVADYIPDITKTIRKRLTRSFVPFQTLADEALGKASPPPEKLVGLSKKKKEALEKQYQKEAEEYYQSNLRLKLEDFNQEIQLKLTDAQIALLKKINFDASFVDGMSKLIEAAYAKPIATDIVEIRKVVLGEKNDEQGPGKLLLLDKGTNKEQIIDDLTKLQTLQEAQEFTGKNYKNLLPTLSSAVQALALEIVRAQLRPNVTFNEETTRERRVAAADAVIPVSYTYAKNQLIVGEGEEVTREKKLVLRYLNSQSRHGRFFVSWIGTSCLIYLLVVLGFGLADANIKKFKLENRDFIFLAVTLVGTVLVFRFWLYVVNGIVDKSPELPELALVLVFPVAFAAMLTRYMMSFEVAIIQAICVAVVLGLIAQPPLPFAVHTFITGLVAAHFAGKVRRRASLLKAGVFTGLASMGGAAFIMMIEQMGLGFLALEVLVGAFVGGLLAGFAVIAISPLFEWIFGYLTHIKLLEMANYENPLLNQIIIKTPGTFQHSVAIGSLAEAAAEYIGIDPLLIRVGALYHDAGKSENPQFFIENQSGFNPHDELPPDESVAIIRNHVLDGLKLVRKYRMGKWMERFVTEHHGTGEIRYFLDRAEKMGMNPKVEDYSYPGPKPQTKSTGILMIADQIEATTRSLDEKTPEAVKGVISKTIERIKASGQLDECPLSLKDLTKIQEAFVNVLTGQYHPRVAYPKRGTERKTAESRKIHLAK